MVITFFDFKGFLKFFIHQNNDWTEGYIHKVVDKKATIEWYDSFVIVHGLN